MTFSQMHERLRLVLLRRIQRGTLSVSQLARQTEFGQPHLSNFLNRKKQLSLKGLDRVLAAQRMTAADLLPEAGRAEWGEGEDLRSVPVVSHATAIFEPQIRGGAAKMSLQVPAGLLERTRARPSQGRRSWLRFVAVQIPALDAIAMDPRWCFPKRCCWWIGITTRWRSIVRRGRTCTWFGMMPT